MGAVRFVADNKRCEFHNGSKRVNGICFKEFRTQGDNVRVNTQPVIDKLLLKMSHFHVCFSTVTCKVLLNQPQCKIGQHDKRVSLC